MIIYNRGITKHYEIIDKFEAGISLKGYEVKSIRIGALSFKGAYISLRGNELWLIGMQISKWKYANNEIDNIRLRKLLLHKSEIVRIISKLKDKSMTMIPLSIYDKNNKIKLEIALARGLKKFDVKAKEKELDKQRKAEIREAKLK